MKLVLTGFVGRLGFEAEFQLLNAGTHDAAHLDVGSVDADALARLGHMTKMIEDQPADGVDAVSLQIDTEFFFEVIEPSASIQ
jgi:hypothetical protein